MAVKEVTFEKAFPYSYGGISANSAGNGQFICDCPFCDKENHFYIDKKTGQYDCKVCDKKGNIYSFIRWLYEEVKANQNTKKCKSEFAKLCANRGLEAELLQEKGVVFYEEQNEWLIPVKNLAGNIVNLRRFYPAVAGKRAKRFALPGVPLSLGGLESITSTTETIYLCEGEWDGFALVDLLREAGVNEALVGVLWLPGSGALKETWVDVFKDRKVVLVYDNDKAGKKAVSSAANLLCNSGILEKDLSYVNWEAGGFTKEGFDLRDFYLKEGSFEDLQKLRFEIPKEAFVDRVEKTSEILASFKHISERTTEWRTLLSALGKNFSLSRDLELGFKLLVSNVLSLNLSGTTPYWVHLVSPAGSAKTELISAFGTCRHVYILSNASAKSLVSGFPGKGGTDPSLIPRIIGKCLMIKDFTEILNMARGDQEEMMGVFRGAYDGYIVKCFGNGIIRQYPECHFNIVTGVTQVIYGENKAAMGERFLKFAMIKGNSFTDIDEVLLSSIKQTGHEGQIREELQAAVKEFCEVKFSHDDIPELQEDDKQMLVGLSRVLSFLRAEVSHIVGTEVLAYKPQIEYGTRPMKVMSVILKILGMVNGASEDYLPTDEDREIVTRVAVSSMTPFCFDIAKCLYEAGDQGLTKKGILESLGMQNRAATIYHYLSILENVEFVLSYEGEKDDPTKPGNPPRYFRLTDEAFEVWEKSRIQDFISSSPIGLSNVPKQKNRHKNGFRIAVKKDSRVLEQSGEKI